MSHYPYTTIVVNIFSNKSLIYVLHYSIQHREHRHGSSKDDPKKHNSKKDKKSKRSSKHPTLESEPQQNALVRKNSATKIQSAMRGWKERKKRERDRKKRSIGR